MKFKHQFTLAVFWLLFFNLTHLNAQASEVKEKGLQDVTLSLKWTHQFQFAGFYIAKELGFYQQAGLNVTFLEAEPAIDPIQRVLDGQADFGVGTSDLILNYAAGDPVVLLGVTMQHSPLGLLTINPEIQSMRNLFGKKIMIEENSAELFALLELNGLKREDFILHRHHLSLNDLISKKVDAMSIYKTTELADIMAKGIDFKVFYPTDSGIDFYGDNLFTTQAMVEQNLPLVEGFREASYRGWQYAMQNPDEAIRLILEKYVTNRTYEQLHFEAQIMRELMESNRIYPGKMTLSHWERMAQTYKDLGYITIIPDIQGMLYFPEVKLAEMHHSLIKLTRAIGLLLIILLILLAIVAYLYLNRKFYQTLVQNVPLGLMVLDKDYQIKKWNKRAEQMFGWSKEEVINRSVFDFLVAHQDITGVRATLNKVLYDQIKRQLINKNYTKSGEIITCSWTNTRVGENGSKRIICMAIDLSEPAELEHLASQATVLNQVNNGSTLNPDTEFPIATDTTAFIPNQQNKLIQAEKLVEIMNQALQIWTVETKKTKVELAEESELWRVTLDGGTAKTRTLDKYLRVDTMPENPRWRTVLDTALFVIKNCKNNPQTSQLKEFVKAFQLAQKS
jgi:PAS domain S-box-containing protein